MKRLLTLVALAATLTASAQVKVVKLWDNASAPHSNEDAGPQKEKNGNLYNTVDTELFIYPAAPDKATGQAVVVCPGGGYRLLCMDYEGYDVAKWFATHGITAAVLKYRMPNGHPEVPLEDAVQALRILSGEVPGAEGFTAEEVGIAGFSAGGHLAAMASTIGSCRPAFSILFYPVITAEEGRCHRGSFDNLLGAARSRTDSEAYSLQRRVTPATPPTLLLLSDDDRTVPPVNATEYYRSLKEHGIDASMHIYPTGGHGWGIRDHFEYKEQWQQAMLDWLKKLNEA